MIARIISFLKTPIGAAILFLAAVFTFFYFVREYRERQESASREGGENVLPQMSPEETRAEPGEPILSEWVDEGTLNRFDPPNDNSVPVVAQPIVQQPSNNASQALPKLLHVYQAPKEPKLPDDPIKPPRTFAPTGTLVPCQLIITVDSSSLQTPVLGFVTEDVWHNQRLILPAGTEVHSFAGQGRVRDRISVTGEWTFVWQDGREVRANGIALDREHDLENDTYAITDGSAGIRGTVHKSDEYLEFKLFTATAIGAAAKSTESTTRSVFGEFTNNSLGNAGLEGVSSVAERYAKLMLDQVEGDGLFVRVPAGTEFYIYLLQVFEPELASVAGLKQGRRPANSWEKPPEPPLHDTGAHQPSERSHRCPRRTRQDRARPEKANPNEPIEQDP